MKTPIATLALVLASALALAGPPEGPRGRMMEELDLSPAQREQIREIRQRGGSRDEIEAVLTQEQQARAKELRAQHHEEFKAMRKQQMDELGVTAEQRAQMREIREAGGSREEMRAVLTEEQRQQLDAKRDEWQQQRGDPPPAP